MIVLGRQKTTPMQGSKTKIFLRILMDSMGEEDSSLICRISNRFSKICSEETLGDRDEEEKIEVGVQI